MLWVGSDGSALARRISLDGYRLNLFIPEPFYRSKRRYAGLCPQVCSLEAGLTQRPDVVVFDSTGMGEIADRLRAYVPIWGASGLADALEFKREFGIAVMAQNGVRIPVTVVFDPRRGEDWRVIARHLDGAETAFHRVRGHVAEAKEFVRALGGRWVVKPDETDVSAETFVADGPDDMLEHLDHSEKHGVLGEGVPFLLQRYVKGIPLSTEAWFANGELVQGSVNGTLEQKHFLAGGLGPQTGAQSAVVWGYGSKVPRIFEEALGTERFLDWLKHPTGPDGSPQPPWNGPIDINCIVDEQSHRPFAIEYTPRQGFNSSYAFATLYASPMYEVFRRAAAGILMELPLKTGYGFCVQVTVPPFPANMAVNRNKDCGHVYRELMGMATGIDIGGPADAPGCWLLDARCDGANLEVAGTDAIVMNVSGRGGTVEEARDEAYALVKQFHIADMQYRIDGADQAIADLAKLKQWGYAT